MVKICENKYTNEHEEKYKNYFDTFSFPLFDFQKWGIESIINNNHTLITSHTGNGKTLIAEFGITFFKSKNLKTIYTTPIKALSNQKYYDFTQKYPHISFGLITGDIKINSHADVLIMTTEILLNKLYQDVSELKFKTSANNLNSFDINIENELGCVVFDEVHFINCQDRGHVWEQTIIMLPQKIQMIMLSATIDKPEKLAKWIEMRYENDDKIVYLAGTTKRVVPLTHYSFITCNNRLFKIIKDKVLENQIKKVINKPIIIKNSGEKMLEENLNIIKKNLKLFETKNIYVKRSFAVNQLLKHMVENNILPAVCFIFSRKNVELTASEVTTNLLEDDSKIPYIMKRECDDIIRKLPNYREYIFTPEYDKIVSLLEKGIGIHHAGILPIYREMIELLYSKGYIKLLFATETFSIGLNMPTKSVIFTDIYKYDNNGMRMLYSHEYTQACGRAGRSRIDTEGYIFQLSNLFRNMETIDYMKMMQGTPQTLVSKFKISYNLLLNLIHMKNYNFTNFIKKSMMQDDITRTLKSIENEILELETELENIKNNINKMNINMDIVQKYIELEKNKVLYKNKKRKDIEKEIYTILEENKIKEYEINSVNKYNETLLILNNTKNDYINANGYLEKNIYSVLDILIENNFVEKIENEDAKTLANEEKIITYKLTIKGVMSSQLREINCMIISPFIDKLNNFTSTEIVGIISCFTNINVKDEIKNIIPYSNNTKLQDFIRDINKTKNEIIEIESRKNVNTGADYEIHFDMISEYMKWCECHNDGQCKILLQMIEKEKDIFLGDFVKGVLKINNIVIELENICEYLCNIELLHKLREIPKLTLKYVATTESLYV